MATRRLTEVRKKTVEPKDSRFTKPKPEPKKETRLRGH